MISKKIFFELYNRNSPKNKSRDIGHIANRYYRRNLSLHIAYSLAQLGVSANSVTLGFLVISLIANVLFVVPNVFTLITLIIIYEIAYVLDSVDGQLARFYGTFSIFGELLDTFSETIIWGSFVIAFGVRLYFETGNPIYIVLGGLGSLSFVTEGLWIKNSASLVGEMVPKADNLMQTLRNIYINLDSMTTISVALLTVEILASFTKSKLPLELFFIVYIVFLISIKIVARLSIIVRKSKDLPRKPWKGW